MESLHDTVIGEFMRKIIKAEEDFIMERLKKQPGFISLEESKHLIEVNRMLYNGTHLGTDYLFNGKCFLTVYPNDIKEIDGKFTSSFNYIEHSPPHRLTPIKSSLNDER